MSSANEPIILTDSDEDSIIIIDPSTEPVMKRIKVEPGLRAKVKLEKIQGDDDEFDDGGGKIGACYLLDDIQVEDAQVEVVDDPDAGFVPAQSNGQSTDDEIELVGFANENRLPHARQDCPNHRYIPTSLPCLPLYSNSFGSALEQNSKHCELCFCYVCDVPVRDCEDWTTTKTPNSSNCHCLATNRGNDGPMWIKLRKDTKDSQRKKSDSNEVYFDDFGNLTGDGPFPPNLPGFSFHAAIAIGSEALTQCRWCSWHSKLNRSHDAGCSPIDYCHSCGRVASAKFLFRNEKAPQYPKKGDFLFGTRCVKFRIHSRDPRRMDKYKDRWKEFENLSTGWTFDRAEMDKEVFEHRFGAFTSASDILDAIPVTDEDKIPKDGTYRNSWGEIHQVGEYCVTETDAIILENPVDIGLFLALSKVSEYAQSTKIQISASWNKTERVGEFTIRFMFTAEAMRRGAVKPELIGSWFELFPFALPTLTNGLTGSLHTNDKEDDDSNDDNDDDGLDTDGPKKLFREFHEYPTQPINAFSDELVNTINTQVKNALIEFNTSNQKPNISFKSSSGHACVGGTCSTATGLKSLLRQYCTDTLADDIVQSSCSTLSWVASSLGIISAHRPPRMSKRCYVSNLACRREVQYLSFHDAVLANENLREELEKLRSHTKSIEGMLQHLENLGYKTDVPYFAEGLTVELMEFQKQTVKWCLDREKIAGGVQSFLWAEVQPDDPTQRPLFYSPVLEKFTNIRPKLVRGGVIAEQMGLGKTVISLALILGNPAPVAPPSGSSIPANFPVDEGRDSLGWDPDTETGINRELQPKRGSILSRGTLVICHVSLVGQWIDEAKSKLVNPGLVYPYHGSGRKRNPHLLAKNAIVVTTYATLVSDQTYWARKSGDEATYCAPCEQVRWWRIICDESHSLRIAATKQSSAVMALVGDHKWCVTGTPINTSLLDMTNQLKFVGIENLTDYKSEFGGTLRHVEDQSVVGRRKRRWCQSDDRRCAVGKFAFFMRNLMIRHAMNQTYIDTGTSLMTLPPKVERVVEVSFTGNELVEYKRLEDNARKLYLKFKQQAHVKKDISKNYLWLSRQLLPLRVACSGGHVPIINPNFSFPNTRGAGPRFSLPNKGKARKKSNSGKKKTDDDEIVEQRKVKQEVKNENAEDSDSDHDASGYDDVGEDEVANELEAIEVDEEQDEGQTKKRKHKCVVRMSDFAFKSKLKILLKELERIRDEEPESKSLVFSQFKSTLVWLQGELPKHGFSFRTLSGGMSMKNRAQALHDFQNDPPTTIFLLSMRASNCGINLTQANRVFLLEPSLNPALEAQAIGRVHRLGQKRSVEIVRLRMKDCLESRLVEILDEKYGNNDDNNNGEGRARLIGQAKAGNLVVDKADMVTEEFDRLFDVETANSTAPANPDTNATASSETPIKTDT